VRILIREQVFLSFEVLRDPGDWFSPQDTAHPVANNLL
jgi:hypothetical protein